MIQVTFEHKHDEFPEITEGPFLWIEMIYGNMFGCRNEDDEAEEIAGVNDDGTWDAGSHSSGRRAYTRWTITQVETEPDHEKPSLLRK